VPRGSANGPVFSAYLSWQAFYCARVTPVNSLTVIMKYPPGLSKKSKRGWYPLNEPAIAPEDSIVEDQSIVAGSKPYIDLSTELCMISSPETATVPANGHGVGLNAESGALSVPETRSLS
jgi:hypothetical protein